MWRNTANRRRACFTLGTTVGIALVVFFIASGRWWLFFLGFIPGYGAAWIGHFFIEKNRPATFQHPLWSFMGDYKMIWLMLTGRMEPKFRTENGYEHKAHFPMSFSIIFHFSFFILSGGVQFQVQLNSDVVA